MYQDHVYVPDLLHNEMHDTTGGQKSHLGYRVWGVGITESHYGANQAICIYI